MRYAIVAVLFATALLKSAEAQERDPWISCLRSESFLAGYRHPAEQAETLLKAVFANCREKELETIRSLEKVGMTTEKAYEVIRHLKQNNSGDLLNVILAAKRLAPKD